MWDANVSFMWFSCAEKNLKFMIGTCILSYDNSIPLEHMPRPLPC